MSNNQEFDYGATGASEGRQITYIAIKAKDAKFQIGKDGPLAPAFRGRLVDFKIRWIEEPGHVDIPPHWEYILGLKAMDVESGEVKDYAITFSSHWRSPATGSMLNALAGKLIQDPSWNGAIEISIWASQMKNSTRTLLNCKLRDLDGNAFPLKYPWDDVNREFTGMPKIVSVGAHETPDFTEQNAFLKAVADEIAGFFGNDPGTKSLPAQSQSQPSTTTAAPATTSGANEITNKALAFFKKSCDGAGRDHAKIVEAGIKTIELLLAKKQDEQPSVAGYDALIRSMVGYGITAGMQPGTFAFVGTKASFSPAAPVPETNMDDLPF